MHQAAIDYVCDVVDRFDLTGSVLDLGGRDVNGSARPLFDGRYVTVDLHPHPSVDVVGDAADVDLEERFDVVISTECLEHAERACEIVANAWRHLAEGGMFVATMAGPGRAPHSCLGDTAPPVGEWYRNVFPAELETWLQAAGFDKFEIDVAGPDVRCWATKS